MGRPKKDGTPAKARSSKACSVLVPGGNGTDGEQLYRRLDAPGGLKQAKEIIAGMTGSLDGVEIVIKSKRPERTTKVKFV